MSLADKMRAKTLQFQDYMAQEKAKFAEIERATSERLRLRAQEAAPEHFLKYVMPKIIELAETGYSKCEYECSIELGQALAEVARGHGFSVEDFKEVAPILRIMRSGIRIKWA